MNLPPTLDEPPTNLPPTSQPTETTSHNLPPATVGGEGRRKVQGKKATVGSRLGPRGSVNCGTVISASKPL